MLSPRRLAIAAGDPRQALTFQAHLRRSLALDAPVVRFDDLQQILTPEADGDVLVFALEPADAAAVETAIREARVQRLPASFTLVESEAVRNLRLLDHLSPHVATRWFWPAQVRDMTAWARRALRPGRSFADPSTETVAERFHRRLATQTPSQTGMVDRLCHAANHDVAVLIEGEAGSGKSQLARMIHDSSARGNQRFLEVSCAALAGTALAVELFGSSTDIGKLAAAGDGTVFLDEIDSLRADHQAALLRLLESGEYEPIGSHETRRSRARIITATNWSLAEAVERGAFRRDLYYRLNIINLHLPPLRHRPEDIGPLVRSMVARFGTRFGKKLFAICPETLRALEACTWPGNIRQLESVIQQSVLASAGNELKLHHLPAAISLRGEPRTAIMPLSDGFSGTLKQSRESSERANIIRALEKTGQSRTRAAQLLGVSRVTLYKKMKKYGLASRTADEERLVGASLAG